MKLFMILLFIPILFCCERQNKINNELKDNKIKYRIEYNAEYELLRNANTFSVGKTGYGGEPSEETVAFKCIFNNKNAKILFKSLIEEENIQGKLYALCGLYYYDYNTYSSNVDEFEHMFESVMVMRGCIIIPENLSTLILSAFKNNEYPHQLYEYINSDDFTSIEKTSNNGFKRTRN